MIDVRCARCGTLGHPSGWFRVAHGYEVWFLCTAACLVAWAPPAGVGTPWLGDAVTPPRR